MCETEKSHSKDGAFRLILSQSFSSLCVFVYVFMCVCRCVCVHSEDMKKYFSFKRIYTLFWSYFFLFPNFSQTLLTSLPTQSRVLSLCMLQKYSKPKANKHKQNSFLKIIQIIYLQDFSSWQPGTNTLMKWRNTAIFSPTEVFPWDAVPRRTRSGWEFWMALLNVCRPYMRTQKGRCWRLSHFFLHLLI